MDREVSDTTLRARRNEWIEAGVFDRLVEHSLVAYDRIIGLDLDDVAIDGSNQKAPCGGEGTGVNPFDRGKLGWKWCMGVDAKGIPIAWTLDGANRNDFKMLEPTLDQFVASGLINDIDTLHLDRGFSYPVTPKLVATYGIETLDIVARRKPGAGAHKLVGLGQRWIVEAANSWLTDYGQLRRNTDRQTRHRHAALALATTFLITSRLIDHRDRYCT